MPRHWSMCGAYQSPSLSSSRAILAPVAQSITPLPLDETTSSNSEFLGNPTSVSPPTAKKPVCRHPSGAGGDGINESSSARRLRFFCSYPPLSEDCVDRGILKNFNLYSRFCLSANSQNWQVGVRPVQNQSNHFAACSTGMYMIRKAQPRPGGVGNRRLLHRGSLPCKRGGPTGTASALSSCGKGTPRLAGPRSSWYMTDPSRLYVTS